MAAASLLALIDDIATILDDVSIMSKVAMKKTAAVLGDDLALNAQQVSGVNAERELPVVWAVAKGSLINKLILVPAALLISAFVPWLITPLLMIGGAYLCFEGAEKVLHHFWPHASHEEIEHKKSQVDEKTKIKGAIRTDFILSAEIITIALSTVSDSDLIRQLLALSFIAIGITVFVYGLVALIVKMDDFGLYLLKKEGAHLVTRLSRRVGSFVLSTAPKLLKLLTIAGTIAMFLVGGGIIVHGIPGLHHEFEHWVHWQQWQWLADTLFNLVIGFLLGLLVINALKIKSLFSK